MGKVKALFDMYGEWCEAVSHYEAEAIKRAVVFCEWWCYFSIWFCAVFVNAGICRPIS